MSLLLKLALGMDWLNDRIGKLAAWCVMLSAVICAGTAFVRYGLNMGSNGWLDPRPIP